MSTKMKPTVELAIVVKGGMVEDVIMKPKSDLGEMEYTLIDYDVMERVDADKLLAEFQS